MRTGRKMAFACFHVSVAVGDLLPFANRVDSPLESWSLSEGVFEGVSSRRQSLILNRPLAAARYICSLAPLTRSAALRFAPLALSTYSFHGLTHSLRSLPRGTVEILEYVFTLISRFTGRNAFFVLTRNTP